MSYLQHAKNKNVRLFKQTVDQELVKNMKNADPLFKKTFRKVFYAGSYRKSGTETTVGDADEIDLIFEMELPFQDAQVKTTKLADWVQFKLKREVGDGLPKSWRRLLPQLVFLLNDHNRKYLERTKLTEWLKTTLDKASLTLDHDRWANLGVDFVRSGSKSKPSRFTSKIGKEILHVNLVLAIREPEFAATQKQKRGSPRLLLCKRPPPSMMGVSNFSDQLFQTFVPQQEEKPNPNKGSAKIVLQTYKKLQNGQKWDFIKLYYLKYLFLWRLNAGQKGNEADTGEQRPWDEIFEKAVVDLVDEIDWLRVIFMKSVYGMDIPTRRTLKMAAESPHEFAENLLANIRSRLV